MKNKKVQIGDATLFCGDAFEVLPTLDVECDAVISDPPYGITDCKWDKAIPLDTLWTMLDSLTKPSANVVLFACGKFMFELFNSKPKWHRYDLVWAKNTKCGHLNANLMPMRNHEMILVFGRPGYQKASTYIPQKTAGGKKVGIITRNHRSAIYRNKGEYAHTADGFLHPCSVLNFKSEKSKAHPTLKPIPLMEHLVKTYSDDQEVVLDMFMGAGSTGVACANLNRRFIGIEKDEKFFDIACRRIEQAHAERKE